MSKLDEIQERIESLPTSDYQIAADHALLVVLSDIVGELKRIDAERKAMDKVLVDLLAKDT